MTKDLPSLGYLNSCFSYDPETGVLTWRRRPIWDFANLRAQSRCNSMYAGKPAGNIDQVGYCVVRLDRTPYKAHRIIWKMMTGDEPPETIDHVNGNKVDNRWCNLRAATQTDQSGNQRIHRTNTSGYRGVYLHGRENKWVAQLAKEYLGYFDTREEAAETYDKAALEKFGEFYRR